MVKINFVGDIALFKEFQDLDIDPFKEIDLPESDYNVGNFEFIIPDNRSKLFFDVLDQYAVDYKYFNSLNLNAFNAFGLANNHCMDYGREGIEDVCSVFRSRNIGYFGTGTGDFNELTFELNGLKFALIAVVKNGRWSKDSPELFGPDRYDIEKITEKISYLKQRVNHVIVFPHFGTELVDIPDPDDVMNSRLMIEAGASAVIGHHPHIIQGMELYMGGVILYSLGSFIYIPEKEEGFTPRQNKDRYYSICLNLKFDEKQLLSADPEYYRYDEKLKIPVRLSEKVSYFEKVNSLIDDRKSYYNKIRRELLSREISGFYNRFKKNPLSTIRHYLGYVQFKHFKKLVS